MAKFLQEIDALQRWAYKAATLKSMRLTDAPPTIARPVILWENPNRGKARNLDQYTYVVRVQQFGKLYVNSFDQAAIYQESLLSYLEEKYGVLEVYENDESINQVALLKQVEVTFNNSESLDIPVVVTYEATYSRTRPQEAPPAAYVGTKLTVKPE